MTKLAQKLIIVSILSFLMFIVSPFEALSQDMPTTVPNLPSVFDNSAGSTTGLPSGAEQGAQNLVKSINTSPIETATTGYSKGTGCENCGWDVFCALECFIIDVFNAIAEGLIGFSDSILQNTIAGNFTTGLGYTPNDNPIISEGWGIVRNTANAALVLGLVFIAINIILGREESKSKSMLINFIIIALLINFTPVICGFIIDGSNIITGSFTSGGFNNEEAGNAITNGFIQIKQMGRENFFQQAMNAIILLIFSLFFSVILLLYALLFFVRTIVLWVLVIVSPIAFATYVFPQFKHITKIFPSILYWDDWWGAFWQWCFIGIPAGLSIYLSSRMIGMIGEISAKITTSQGNIWASILAYMLPFMFLLVGFFMSISTGTKAASKLSGELTDFGKRAVGFAGRAGLGVAGGVAGATVGAVAGAAGLREGGALKNAVAGWSSGKETAQKEGVVGSAMIAGGKVVGGAAGFLGGAETGLKNWAMRRSAESRRTEELGKIEGQLEGKEISKVDYHQERERINTEADEQIEKYGAGTWEEMKKQGREGWKGGAVDTVSRVTGKTIGGALGGAYGAAIRPEAEGRTVSPLEGAARVGEAAAKRGEDVSQRTLGKIGTVARETAKRGAKDIYGTMTKKISQVEKKEKKTEEEWKKKVEEDHPEVKIPED